MPVTGAAEESVGSGEHVPGVSGLGWREVFDLSPTAMSIIDTHGRQLAGNRAYAELLGYEPEEVGRIDVGAVSRPEDREWSAGYLARLATGEIDEYSTVKRYRRSDGSEVVARLHARALRDGDGRCLALIGSLTPAEPRGGVDDARLRRFLAYAHSTFTVVDVDGRVLETTGMYQPILGYPPEFWAERTVFDLLVPDSVEAALVFRQELLDRPGELRTVELSVRGADGSTQVLRVEAINLLADPDVAGVVVSSQNVTQERQLMAELASRRDTAEAVADARANLLATVSHELRNPLHAVQGLAELLAVEELPPRAAALAMTLAQQLAGLASVTEDLLDTAQLDAGAIELRRSPIDLHELVREVAGYGSLMAGDRPLSVVADLAPDAPGWVFVDGQRLRQVLRNLVGNAVKFTPQGVVTVGVVPSPAGISVTVVDTGVGIPADELDAVLQPFRTGSSAGDGRGAGLGLAIVQRVVSAMGGSVVITSELGRGTHVRLELPLVAAVAPDLPAPAPDTSTRERAITVLVVEDDPVNQQLALGQLEHLSMTPVIVDSGEAAVELLGRPDRPHVDVILMDQQLPGMTGIETARQLRAMGPLVASIRIIGLTASASAANRDEFLDAGLDGFVAKPARLDDIRSAIEEALGRDVATDVHDRPTAAEGTPDASSEDLIDPEVLHLLSAEFGDVSIVRLLVQTFLDELPKRRKVLLGALRAGDADAAGRAAHTVRSSARLLGAGRLGDACETIERSGRIDPDSLETLMERTGASMASWLEGVT